MRQQTFQGKLNILLNKCKSEIRKAVQENRDNQRESYKTAFNQFEEYRKDYISSVPQGSTNTRSNYQQYAPYIIDFDFLFPKSTVSDSDVNGYAEKDKKAIFQEVLESCKDEYAYLLMNKENFIELANEYGYYGTELAKIENQRIKILDDLGFVNDEQKTTIKKIEVENKYLSPVEINQSYEKGCEVKQVYKKSDEN